MKQRKKRNEWLQPFIKERAKVLKQHLAGKSINELARSRGVSVTTIQVLLKKAKHDKESAS